MHTTITAMEFESMLFVRHLTLTAARRTARNIDRSAYTILTCLDESREMSMAELSETLGLDTSTLSRQTSAMLQAGLIERIPDPNGGIARKFRSTAEGSERLHDACEANAQLLQEVTADWSPHEVDNFAHLLGRFNRGIELLDQRPWPRPSSIDDQQQG